MSKIKLLNDFSFGFELEGTFDSNLISREELNYQMDEFLGGKGNMQYDGSLRTSTSPNYRRFNECFEYSSPVINFTYANMNKVIKFLDKCRKYVANKLAPKNKKIEETALDVINKEFMQFLLEQGIQVVLTPKTKPQDVNE